ncbi:MAG: SusC/RagA family TonB-linked outer membrane protein [Bacteroidales bacterium]
MTKIQVFITRLALLSFMISGVSSLQFYAQDTETEVSGVIVESGTGSPLALVSISVVSTGNSSGTNENGEFTITVPNLQAELIINLPGYNLRNVYLNGRDYVKISLVPSQFKSLNTNYNTPLGQATLKNQVFPVTALDESDIKNTKASSFDQVLQGKAPGLRVIHQSGMPGQRTFMNIRGISSLFGETEPLLFIDGMIHDYAYAKSSLMEGFALNPFDIVDINDISDISVIRDGVSYLGAAGSNGIIYVNTEEKEETSSAIKFSAYGGIAMTPAKQDLLNADQFRNYFVDVLGSQGYDAGEINTMYPWLSGPETAENYYKYNNSTDWQDEIFKPATIQKYHFFLKGGDDIATYNISTGYLSHKGIYENSKYTRFNLRINGRINISDKFSVTPNAKLSLADTEIANHGPNAWKNPILSSLLKPPIMAPNARDESTGVELNYLDNEGDIFKVSNPTALIENALGANRNYHFLSSVTANYNFNEHFNLSTLVGINFNNARENIFLPDNGIVQVDSAFNSPGDFVYEFRSTQNHTMLTYTNKTESGHSVIANAGFRYMENNYKYNLSIDLNTPSDDFRSLGDGAQFSFLRSTTGDNRGLSWISYFGNLDYSFRDKYFLSTNLSYDGNSATNENNRYNFYPSVGAAWRLSSENFLNQASWLADLKLRGSYSVSGNMFSTIYDYSKLYYTNRRLNGEGVLTREVIPNEDLELEKKTSINAGLDLSLFNQNVNVHFDYYTASVNNLVVEQELPSSFGFTSYYDNGGELSLSGIELAADTRLQAGDFVWQLGGTMTKESSEVTSLSFLNPETEFIVHSIPGAQLITSEGNPVNAYYGYQTAGLISASEAGTIIGPKGVPMLEGDIKYVDVDQNNIIDDLDKQIIGDPNPDLFGRVFTSFTFKNLELSASIFYSMGNEAFNYMKYKTEAMNSYDNQSTAVLERWTPENTDATLPRISYGDPTGNTVFSDRWIEDASFIRLDKLTLSYTLEALPGIYRGVVVYVTATNLLTITDYSGYDPDFIFVNSPYYMGVDYGKMPQTRSFIIGVKLDL